jgi:RHS repeat-associated protein
VSQILFDGGYVTLSGSTPTYHYYLQDHLGNNRVVVKQDGTIEQVNHYYPFGGLFGESTNGDVQRFKYNGKELERMHGLDWYDYGARWHDAALGRWATVDPMAEKYYNLSPYNYCGNNPIKFIDLHGDSIYFDIPVIQNGEVVSSTRYTYGKYGNTYGFGRNGELYQGSNTTITAVSNSLNKISSGGGMVHY